ncbi:hypothetical protein MNBD_NITROSPINAE04-2437 [hydrothermal vent metagenome]|uniref:Uncharacterized protein n=1 Tax=hydrothermal vent metagenome TaxID=652676 RepID=A0A3B1C648_9ZZZZ
MSDDEINEAMAIAMTVGASKIRCLYNDSLASLKEKINETEAEVSKGETPPEESCSP